MLFKMNGSLIHLSLDELNTMHQTLISERMTLDLDLTNFLTKNERKMDFENTDTEIWNDYKIKANRYSLINKNLNKVDWYIKKYV